MIKRRKMGENGIRKYDMILVGELNSVQVRICATQRRVPSYV